MFLTTLPGVLLPPRAIAADLVTEESRAVPAVARAAEGRTTAVRTPRPAHGDLCPVTGPWRTTAIRGGTVAPVLPELPDPGSPHHVVQAAPPVLPRGRRTPAATRRDLTVVPVRPSSPQEEAHD